MSKYLLEIGTEEIPARFLPQIIKDYKSIFESALQDARILFDSVKTYATPRRIVVLIEGISDHQSDLEAEIKGPASKIAYNEDKTPSKALQGFMKSNGILEADIFEKQVGSTAYIFAKKHEKGISSKKILAELLPNLILSASFPKNMRWGDSTIRYVRPIKWLLSLWDTVILPFEIDRCQANNYSFGHRFLSKEQLTINSVDEYFEKLKTNYVIVNQEERLALISKQIDEICEHTNVTIVKDQELLDEVLYLIEYPTVFLGDFDKKYLQIPEELVVTPMKEHQRYFSVTNKNGSLMNHFVTVKNGTSEDIEIVKRGNEKVLEARLADAKFFYDEDLKIRLENNIEKLKNITFQEKLGTVYDKMERVVLLSEYLGAKIFNFDSSVVNNALVASKLLKADLVSNVVTEFPELQGIMGEEYALKTMELDVNTAKAIREHYLPRFSGDKLPETKEGFLTSISDKLDTIVGCFVAGIEPTGSQDPYALRRQAMAIVQMIIHEKAHISLKEIIEKSALIISTSSQIEKNIVEKVYDFFYQRVLTFMKEEHFSLPFIRAILSEGYDDIYGCIERAKLLYELSKKEEFSTLEATYKRVNNMLSKHEPIKNVETILSAEETLLATEINALFSKSDIYEKIMDYERLSIKLNEYMDNTMIMVEDEDLRAERLSVLKLYKNLYVGLIDFSLL